MCLHDLQFTSITHTQTPTMSSSLLLTPNSSLLPHRKFITKSSSKHNTFLLPFSSTNVKFNLSIRSSYSSNEPTDPASKPEPVSKFFDSDPPIDEDEWGDKSDSGIPSVNVDEDDELFGLKRALVDTVYGSELGFRASAEVRGEALELISLLEAKNPTPYPNESTELLDGNWVLVYTAYSELLPLLATGSIPLVKVEKICQIINTSSSTIDNSVTLSTPGSTLSFSASASFEIRSPSRIQVEFKEGTFKPPEIKSRIDLPESITIFGQDINLISVQQNLGPIQGAVSVIAQTISGQPPLKIPIPGDRSKSWLVTTYLDKEFRISRGDGGLFVLVKEGSTLLE